MSWKCTPYTSPTGHHSWVAGPTVGICYFPCGYGVSGSCSSLPPSIIREDLTVHDSLSKTFEFKIQSVASIEFVFLCTITKLKDYEWSYHGSGPTVLTQGIMVAKSLLALEYWGLLLSFTFWLDFLNECISMYKCNLMLTVLLIQRLCICVLCIVTSNYHCVNGLTDKFPSEDYTSQVRGSLSSP